MAIVPNFNNLVFIKNFNNYFNRKIIGSPTLEGYAGQGQTYNGEETTSSTFFDVDDTEFELVDGVYVAEVDLTGKVPCGKVMTISTIIASQGTAFTYVYSKVKNTLTITTTTQPISQEYFTVDYSYDLYAMEKRENINFNENDGVLTEIVVNDLSFHPDYMLVLDSSSNIVSRWFVMETVRNRAGQYHCSLKRDVIYDNLDDLLDSPIFVQKGMLDDDDSFAVNSEGMMVNQIKTSETRLVDGLGKMAWIVLYIAKNTPDTTNTGSNIQITIKASHNSAGKVNYDMVAIPLYYFDSAADLTIIDLDGTEFTSSSAYIISTFNEIITALDAYCYDAQILPYCPIPAAITADKKLDLRLLPNPTENTGFNYIYNTNTSTKIGVSLYPINENFETDLTPETGTAITTSLSKKESSNLQLFRFVSPNYQGTFDLNIAKNNNKIDNIKAYCTYKPYTPLIKVVPTFYNFYGSNYKDARGLVCGGDFSIGKISDAWINFQLNNKNYQNIFNREIQNMEFTQNIEMRNQIVSASVGAIGAGAAGATAGMYMGGPIGAAIGAGAGILTSAAGGVIDTITMAQQHKEAKSLAIDKFNYQLGNIQALPYTLTKVNSYDFISKIFPFVEQYDCTAEELTAFRNKIKYESMTVMRIDTMNNYYHLFDELCYFKGELIRNEKIAGDNHLFDAIYSELLKGVYI